MTSVFINDSCTGNASYDNHDQTATYQIASQEVTLSVLVPKPDKNINVRAWDVWCRRPLCTPSRPPFHMIHCRPSPLLGCQDCKRGCIFEIKDRALSNQSAGVWIFNVYGYIYDLLLLRKKNINITYIFSSSIGSVLINPFHTMSSSKRPRELV